MPAAIRSIKAGEAALRRWAELDGQRATIEEARRAAIAQTNAQADADVMPINQELGELTKQIAAWWPSVADRLTPADRRSVELGGCMIGYRSNPASVVFSIDNRPGDDAAALAALKDAGLDQFIRTTSAPDKQAIGKQLRAGDPALGKLGFALRPTETFFLGRAVQPGVMQPR